MQCPYCNNTIYKGYVQSARNIFWGEKKHKIFFIPSDDDIILSNKLIDGSAVSAECCISCKK